MQKLNEKGTVILETDEEGELDSSSVVLKHPVEERVIRVPVEQAADVRKAAVEISKYGEDEISENMLEHIGQTQQMRENGAFVTLGLSKLGEYGHQDILTVRIWDEMELYEKETDIVCVSCNQNIEGPGFIELNYQSLYDEDRCGIFCVHKSCVEEFSESIKNITDYPEIVLVDLL